MMKGIIKGKEDRLEKAKEFNLMSNVFMSVALKDIPACQHVIRILTDIGDLKVKEVRTQYVISKITSHDSVLDVLAEASDGKMFNIEIQRKDTIDHARRVRFYGAMIDSEYLEKGAEYKELPEVYHIYISEKDIWKKGLTEYWVKSYLSGTDIDYDDGRHILYINTAIDDGSEKSRLMQYFKKADPLDMSQGDLSKRVNFLKSNKEGRWEMRDVAKEIYDDGVVDGIREGKLKERKEMLEKLKLIKNGEMSIDQVINEAEMEVEE